MDVKTRPTVVLKKVSIHKLAVCIASAISEMDNFTAAENSATVIPHLVNASTHRVRLGIGLGLWLALVLGLARVRVRPMVSGRQNTVVYARKLTCMRVE